MPDRKPYWQTDYLYTVPEAPRPLKLPELQRLSRMGFLELAKRLAAGTCPHCELNKLGRGHHDLCVAVTEPKNPLVAVEQPRQPWEPRHGRMAA